MTDEKSGKKVQIPRPLHALRIWNATTKSYDEVSTLLDGAPSDEEKDKYWTEMILGVR